MAYTLYSDTRGPGLELRLKSIIRLFNVMSYALRIEAGIEGPEMYLVSNLSLLTA